MSRAAAVLALLALVSCAPQTAPRTESGFLPPEMCSAIGWPGALLGVLTVAAATFVALFWIQQHYQTMRRKQ